MSEPTTIALYLVILTIVAVYPTSQFGIALLVNRGVATEYYLLKHARKS